MQTEDRDSGQTKMRINSPVEANKIQIQLSMYVTQVQIFDITSSYILYTKNMIKMKIGCH